MVQYKSRLGSLTLVKQPVFFKLTILCLKIDLVSHPANGGQLDKYVLLFPHFFLAYKDFVNLVTFKDWFRVSSI